MALGSTQPLTEMSTRSISWGLRRPISKADNLPPSCAFITKSENLNFLEFSGLYLCGSYVFYSVTLQSCSPPPVLLCKFGIEDFRWKLLGHSDYQTYLPITKAQFTWEYELIFPNYFINSYTNFIGMWSGTLSHDGPSQILTYIKP